MEAKNRGLKRLISSGGMFILGSVENALEIHASGV